MPLPKDPEKLAQYRQKMSEIALARGYGKWMTGKRHTEESRAKMREVQQAIGREPAERARRSERAKSLGYGKWMSGRQLSPETVEKIVAYRKGKSYPEIYGDTRASEEARKRREGNRRRFIGRVRKADVRPKHNSDYRYTEWRTAVFRRDDYTCQACGVRGGRLNAHHIKRWSRHPELRYAVENGKTLCISCHRAADRENRS
jgi:5-methylcytosine-specific restriction endonuclease McrA